MTFDPDDRAWLRSELAVQLRAKLGFEPPPALADEIAGKLLDGLAERINRRDGAVANEEEGAP